MNFVNIINVNLSDQAAVVPKLCLVGTVPR